MTPIFLDTSGLVAIVNLDDQWHVATENEWRRIIVSGAPLVTTSLVLIEIGDGLARVKFRSLAIDLYDRLTASPRVEVVPITAEIEAAGWELYRQRPDKDWGMTDCISMTVMQRMGVDNVFSCDGDFAQAGYKLLLQAGR